jgi:hypothetical protein
VVVHSWQDAERLAASWMRSNGFRGAAVTQGGSDGGVDVKAPGAIAQVKRESKPVGRPALQRLAGARGRAQTLQMLFFSSSGYSPAAIEYAGLMDLALFTYTPGGLVSPLNNAARRVERNGRRERQPSRESRARARARARERLRGADRQLRELDRRSRTRARATRCPRSTPMRSSRDGSANGWLPRQRRSERIRSVGGAWRR